MRRFPVRRLGDCHTVDDFRELARKKLPYPVFHYIDGAADDEVTRNRNTQAYEDCDLVPNVLAGVADIDMSTTLMGRKIDMPLFLSPTALQRLFHWRGEKAVGAAAEKFGTFFGISSLATVSLAAKDAKFDALALTVDTIVSGKRERCLHTGFTSPPRLTPSSAISFATHPGWTLNYLGRERFSLPNLESHVAAGTDAAISVADYFNTMLDQNMDWAMAEQIRSQWGGPFCLKGVMSVEDARQYHGDGPVGQAGCIEPEARTALILGLLLAFIRIALDPRDRARLPVLAGQGARIERHPGAVLPRIEAITGWRDPHRDPARAHHRLVARRRDARGKAVGILGQRSTIPRQRQHHRARDQADDEQHHHQLDQGEAVPKILPELVSGRGVAPRSAGGEGKRGAHLNQTREPAVPPPPL